MIADNNFIYVRNDNIMRLEKTIGTNRYWKLQNSRKSHAFELAGQAIAIRTKLFCTDAYAAPTPSF